MIYYTNNNYTMKKISLLSLSLLLALGMVSCGNSQSKNETKTTTNASTQASASIAKNISTTQFQELIKTKPTAQVVDVRTPQEVAAGVIEGSVALDFYSPDFKSNLNKLDKNAPVLVYCAVGGRSGNAMQLMKQMGFKEVYNLSGGYRAWASQGLPTK